MNFAKLISLNPSSKTKLDKDFWQNVFVQYVLAIFSYTFMEWLFYVTKPSFMDYLDLFEKLSVLLISGLLIFSVGFLVAGILFLINNFLLPEKLKPFIFPTALVPALFYAITTLLLVDNFTYTIFKWGIVSTEGFIRGMYGLAFV